MLKNILLLLVFVTTSICFSQNNFESELDSIQTLDEAKIYVKKNKSLKGKVITFNKEKHHTQIADELFRLAKGSKKVYKTDMEKTYYKVVDKNEIPYQKLSYIYLDGKEKSMEEINILRHNIIAKYRNGFRFEDLAKLYSMDTNAKRGGDLGWVTQGDLHPDFEAHVLDNSHEVNDIFTVDIPKQQWYYVILKTEGTKFIEEIKVLKVTEPVK
ncbi:peptidylprolyl isomerase [Psychroserpens ponticola]|uniref:Peptidylprolyl isomerase n=1 Tax=Psychroserpens ponticola TaxID=2932268 RepID=A0ABY7S2D8_9FLAO|nr:peptidylprolyl isomerase [Psychroserpens ponticola]WCO03298.1 peptidylprolyl isomerase [Psychroserpens ponticola]